MPVTKKNEKKKKKKKKTRPQMLAANEKMAAVIRQANIWTKWKKDQTTSWWQTKKGCRNQASKQLTPNERNKTAETTSKTQTVAYLQK